MRLLELNNHDEFSLTKYLTSNIPPYAILSHTWGEDDEEVTFQDLMQGVGKSKAGYGKIRFCGKQAAENGLRYIWIDTCCIDKLNSTELGEALNSMFRWYSSAARCYVYLSDVSHNSKWELAFRNSRWFTRGWTLQELLAPGSVEFFSKEGKLLGSKDSHSLGHQICKITGVPIEALQGRSLSSFSVPARLSWAAERETKRQEDKVYSLMGIFGIHMVPIYGEGAGEALERLKIEIDRRNTQQEKQMQVFYDENRFDAGTFTDQDEPGTLFDLIPKNQPADDIVRGDVNGRMRRDPDDPSKRLLRIGFQVRSKTPGVLIKFGRCVLTNDVVLGQGWSKMDQCYFDMHSVTHEVLLHDVSTRQNTQLRDREGTKQIRKSPRQCVVLLDREWRLEIGRAVFLLQPRIVQDLKVLAKEKLSFIHQPTPEEYEGTYEGTLQQMLDFDLRSVGSSVYNTRMNTPFQPEPDNEIKYTILKKLGGGSQGKVYEVVDMHTGDYLACKVIRFKKMPKLGIATEKDFKRKAEARVALLSKLFHEHVLGYVSSQGWLTGCDINIFQQVCEESFDEQIKNFKSKKERETKTRTMFHHVSLGLDYIHTFKPPIIHKDIKPSNILYRSEKYLISDFDIAETVDNSHTISGTGSYMPPELRQGGDQTTAIDIYELGVTIVEALEGFPDLEKRPASWQEWHHHLQALARGYPIVSMLASSPNDRPTAHRIVSTFFPDSLPSTEWVQLKIPPKIPRPNPRRDVVSRRRKQSDVAYTKPAKSTTQERKKSGRLGAPSRNEGRARFAVVVSNQSKWRRSRSTRVRAKDLSKLQF